LIIIMLFDIIAGFVLVNRSFTKVYIVHPEIPDNHCERKRAKITIVFDLNSYFLQYYNRI